MSLFEKVRLIAKQEGISLTELGVKAGLGSRSIYNWKTNSPTVDNLISVAKVLGVGLDELIDLDAQKEQVSKNISSGNSQVLTIYPVKTNPFNHSVLTDPNRIVDDGNTNYQLRIPVIKAKVSGQSILEKHNIADYNDLTFKHKPYGVLFLFKIKTPDMTPTIPINSLATIKQQDWINDGEIAAILEQNEVKIRRIKYINNIPLALSDNVNYAPISLQNEENRIIGKVVHLDFNL